MEIFVSVIHFSYSSDCVVSCLGAGLHQRKVLRDLLEHPDDSGALLTSAVPGLEKLGLRLGSLPRRSFDAAHMRMHLVQLPRLLLDHASALVEFAEDGDRFADCILRIL